LEAVSNIEVLNKKISRILGLTIILLFSINYFISAQNQTRADSLIALLKDVTEIDSTRLGIIYEVAVTSTSPGFKLQYSNLLIQESKRIDNLHFEAAGYHITGVAYRLKGNLEKALSFLFKSAELSEKQLQEVELSETYAEIATCYTLNKDPKNALVYSEKAIDITRKVGSQTNLGLQLINLGYDYYTVNDFASAIKHYREAEVIFDSIRLPIGKAYTIGNRALVYWKQGKNQKAKKDLIEAISMLSPLGDQYGMADFNNQLGKIYFEEDKINKAILYTETGLEMAINEDLKEQVRDAALLLSKLYKKQGNFMKAFEFQSQYISYKDSIQNQETTKRLADLRTDYEVGQKQAELELVEAQQDAERRQSYIIGASMAAVLLLIGIIAYIQYRNIQQRKRINQQLAIQKQELEQLNQTKDRFFSIISHDLRGPVNAFAGISKLIRMYLKKGKIEEINEMAGDIDESAGRLSSLLDNLLEWAVQQQGQFPYAPEKVNFRKVADDLLDTFETMASGKEIKLHNKIADDIWLFVDKNSTTTIFRNLVGNALKFTPEGGEVFFDASIKNDSVSLSVNDTGVGIPKEKFDKLFSLSENKSTWGTSGEKGLGLGLQLAYEFTEMNQGNITVESKEGEGTAFMVELPLFGNALVTEEV